MKRAKGSELISNPEKDPFDRARYMLSAVSSASPTSCGWSFRYQEACPEMRTYRLASGSAGAELLAVEPESAMLRHMIVSTVQNVGAYSSCLKGRRLS